MGRTPAHRYGRAVHGGTARGEGEAVHYGGRRHIERLTNVLIALGDTVDDEPSPEQRAALDALHSALLCRAKPVPLPPDYVRRYPDPAGWKVAHPVASN
jgi:hypothetical protein